MRLRSDLTDGDLDIEEDFYILKRTVCPCVLSESGFMTNYDECRWLMTDEALTILSNVHVTGIINIIRPWQKLLMYLGAITVLLTAVRLFPRCR